MLESSGNGIQLSEIDKRSMAMHIKVLSDSNKLTIALNNKLVSLHYKRSHFIRITLKLLMMIPTIAHYHPLHQ